LTVAISDTSIDRTVSLPRQVELSLQRQNKRASGAITYSTVNGYESADYSFLDTINGASYYVMHRIIVVNKRTYYSLMAVVAAEAGPNAATQERDRFFNSFSFVTK
jgi:hypothetical protein